MPRILAVGIARVVFERLAPVFRRDAFDFDWVPTLEAGLLLVTQKPFEIIILNAEPVDGILAFVLKKIRFADSASRRAAIVVLAEPHEVDAARALKDRGVNEVMLVSDRPQVIHKRISNLLNVPPRAVVHVPIKIGSMSENQDREVFCQTENLSISGMLVKTRQQPQIGSTVAFRIHLSDSIGTICGRGETVRHSTTAQGSVDGAGIRFLSFEADGARRLQHYLDGHILAKEPRPLNRPESPSERRCSSRQGLKNRVTLKVE